MTEWADRAQFRQRYLEALDLKGDDDRKSALNRAHTLRAFEIELYWKRATYVWAFQGAAFAALAFALSNKDAAKEVVMVVCAFGAITAFAALLTARGSKFWQENWESHVDLLEPEEEGRLMQTVVVRGDVKHSVSRVNERLISFLSIGWTLTFVFALLARLAPGTISFSPTVTALLIAAGFVFGMFYVGRGTQSRLDGFRWRPGDSDWQPHRWSRAQECWLIWRGDDVAPDKK